MRVSNTSAVFSSKPSSHWNGSLNPRPGILGTTRWNGCVEVGDCGSVRGAKRGVSERFVSGNVGRSRRGTACLYGDLMCRKWIRRGTFVGVEAT